MADSWQDQASGSDVVADFSVQDARYSNGDFNGHTNGFGNDVGEGAGNDTCNRCHQSGHFARDCTEPRTDIACHNCGGPHMKKDCDQPKLKSCRLCKGEHDTVDCQVPYPIDFTGVPTISEDDCWTLINDASASCDIDDFKDAAKALQKACPELTYPAFEKQLRARKTFFYLIGLNKEIGDGYTNVNLQGEAGQKYVVAVFRSPNCPRPNLSDKWPASSDENLARLTESGLTLTRGLDHCRRCDKYGHISKDCSEEREEVESLKVVCALCSQEGHRVRDCTEPRQKDRAPRICKRCGNEGHIAKECDQPEPALVCHKCNEEGHKAIDCEKLICRNCDKEGHVGKDCTAPRDWSRVVCRHCGEKGHASSSRCKPGAVKLDAPADDHSVDNTDDFTKATANLKVSNSQPAWEPAVSGDQVHVSSEQQWGMATESGSSGKW